MEVVISYYLWENISTNSRLNLWKLWQHQIVVKIFSFFWGLVEKFEKCVLEYIHARWVTWTGKMGRWWRLQTVLPQIKELFNFMFCQKIRGNQYGYKICLRREGTYTGVKAISDGVLRGGLKTYDMSIEIRPPPILTSP